MGLAFILLGFSIALAQNGVGLESMSFSTLPGDQVQVSLKFSGTPPEPLTFTIDNPARVALDFPNTRNLLQKRSQTIGIGLARSVNTAEAKGRTRVVLNLDRLVGYQTEIIGNELLLTLSSGDTQPVVSAAPAPATAQPVPAGASSIQGIDFRRGPAGEGRVLVRLSNPGVPIDLREQGGKIVVDFSNTNVPQDLAQRLDVTDFATPVQSIETFVEGNNTKMSISAKGRYEHLAYQSDDLYTIEVREKKRQPAARAEPRQKVFTGERLSLNFQDIEVRSVLQLIADFTGLNIVVSDTVGGSLTLRLKNVPWDQALDIILKTKGLAMREVGNVILVAPSEEIAAREKLELEAQKQVEELAPLRSEFVQINYAKAADIAALLKAAENSLLSARGNVTIDARTNTLLVQDTAIKLNEVRDLVGRLDVPVRQVLIESRIVIASDDFQKELGARFGLASIDNDAIVGGLLGGPGTDNDFVMLNGSLEDNTRILDDQETELNDRLNVNLPVAGAAGSIGLSLAKLPFGTLIELELSAAQAENRAQTISSPRVITSNQTTARIEQGTEIPFQEASSSGATSVSFKKAVLSLEVTPQITPDDRVFLDIRVSNDTVGENVQQTGGGVAPSIDTREVETRVLVNNGQTVVLGGIHEQRSSEDETKVPFFGDIPLVGRLFKTTRSEDDKSELLIFITPKIINQDLTLAR